MKIEAVVHNKTNVRKYDQMYGIINFFCLIYLINSDFCLVCSFPLQFFDWVDKEHHLLS